MTKEYDLVILGGGTGGYVAAIKASQLKMKVAIVEENHLGGTCLHHGCIPSKSLLRSAEVYRQTKEAVQYGVHTSDTALDFTLVQDRKRNIIETLHQGVQGLIKKGKIDVYKGYGRILGPSIFSPMSGTISVEYKNGEENTMLLPKNVLIATGSKPKKIPELPMDGRSIVTSDELLEMEELPKTIIIVGGGVIGIEWASMLADFGVDVTVVESQSHLLPTEDQEIANEVEKLLKLKGIRFIKQAKLLTETIQEDDLLTVEVERNEQREVLKAEKMLVSIGRTANTNNIGIENTSIKIENQYIQVNEFYQTEESHIYAVGDVIGGMQLAHVASHEGIIAVEHMANENPYPIDYDTVPSCVYSHPEVASVGLTEQQALDRGLDIKIGKFPFKAIGKALVYGESDGFVKMIVNKENEDLLGVHMVGPQVTDMISEAGLAKVLDATPWEITQSVHPHPTLSEIIGEAALAVDGFQIHM